MWQFRPCILIPTYNNAATLASVVDRAAVYGAPVVVVDDGSDAAARTVAESLQAQGKAQVVFHTANRGKGAAVRTGFAAAVQAGFTHALQVDGDGQHDLEQIPVFLRAAARLPTALIMASPVFGPGTPCSRRFGREITNFWVAIETFGRPITDAMVGFRVYPLHAAIAAASRGNRMDFDIEIAVRMVWAATPVLNLPVEVRYLTAAEGGVSHFRMFWDNVRISWLHTRLTTEGIVRRWLLWQRFGRRLRWTP
ncbi:MAG: glycosyltransferase family 2 protein [Myxococcales bacterium]|nr:glycosyltransferase family 2 protein [Myxococcales bacterium]